MVQKPSQLIIHLLISSLHYIRGCFYLESYNDNLADWENMWDHGLAVGNIHNCYELEKSIEK